jgi:NTE family protein
MKIGLALSGGGVLGVAHVSILRQIEENNIKINMVSGSSSGAIIGALFADGGVKTIEIFLDDMEKAGVFTKGNLKFALPDRLFAQVRQSLEKTLEAKKFYDLKTEFSCIASDMLNGKMVILNSGNIIDAVMASAAYPGVFQPQEIDGKILVDGAITRNLPVGVLKGKKPDFIIGSSLYRVGKISRQENGKNKLNRLSTALRALNILQQELAELEGRDCDFLFTPPVDNFNWYSFDRLQEIRKIADEYSLVQIDNLKRELKKKDHKGFWASIFTD